MRWASCSPEGCDIRLWRRSALLRSAATWCAARGVSAALGVPIGIWLYIYIYSYVSLNILYIKYIIYIDWFLNDFDWFRCVYVLPFLVNIDGGVWLNFELDWWWFLISNALSIVQPRRLRQKVVTAQRAAPLRSYVMRCVRRQRSPRSPNRYMNIYIYIYSYVSLNILYIAYIIYIDWFLNDFDWFQVFLGFTISC